MKYSNGHNYMHLNWITVRRDDDKLYKFKEGKLTNLTVEERLAFNVSLRMFTRSIVIQRRVEDLQLGVKSYQKKLKPHQCRMDTTALKDSSIGELGGNICTQTIWKQHDKDNARAMIQSSDKQLKTRRIMRSLEKFVGGWRTYKVVRHRYSNPMIQPEPEGSTQGYLLVSVEVLSHGPSDAMHNPPYPLKVDPHGFEGYLKMEVKLKYILQDFRYSDTVHLS
ncbi:hypothetical protein Tco_0460809 [Tanacetum coccineum]